MIGGQKQEVGENSSGIQSGGDISINIHSGIGPEELKVILGATVASQITAFTSAASQVFDQKIEEFQRRLLPNFTQGMGGRVEAFADPDFQFLVGRSQLAYARSSDDQLCENLVGLIVERSKQKNRSRFSLTLNEAVEKSCVLTKNEFSVLSIAFFFKNVHFPNISDFYDLAASIRYYVIPLLKDSTKDYASYAYLEAQNCATINRGLMPKLMDLQKVLAASYGGILSKGFDQVQLDSRIGKTDVDKLHQAGLIVPHATERGLISFKCLSETDLRSLLLSAGVVENHVNQCLDIFNSSIMTSEEMIQAFTPNMPDSQDAQELFDLWRASPLNTLTLTPVGIAIAYANLARVGQFKNDLRTWIK